MDLLPPILVKTCTTCVVWYVVSSLTSQLTKRVLNEYKYPLFLSQFQFLIGSLLSFSFIIIVRAYPDISRHFPLGSVPQDVLRPIFNLGAFLKISPMGLFQFVGKYCSLSATSLISLAAVSSVKALSPLVIVISYRLIYNVRFSVLTYLSLIPLVGGVILIISSESPQDFNQFAIDANQVKGLGFCFLSLIIFAAQNIYGKQLITWDSNDKSLSPNPNESNGNNYSKYVRQRNNSIKLPYSTSDIRLDEMKPAQAPSSTYVAEIEANKFDMSNPLAKFVSQSDKIAKPDRMTTIFYCSSIGFTISVCGFLFNELPHVLDILSGNIEGTTPDTKSGMRYVFGLILMSSLSHFVQTLLAFHLLGLIPAVSYSIASMMKRIFLITVSIVLATSDRDPTRYFGKLTGTQLVGLLFTAIGLYCYDKWGSQSVKIKT